MSKYPKKRQLRDRPLGRFPKFLTHTRRNMHKSTAASRVWNQARPHESPPPPPPPPPTSLFWMQTSSVETTENMVRSSNTAQINKYQDYANTHSSKPSDRTRSSMHTTTLCRLHPCHKNAEKNTARAEPGKIDQVDKKGIMVLGIQPHVGSTRATTTQKKTRHARNKEK